MASRKETIRRSHLGVEQRSALQRRRFARFEGELATGPLWLAKDSVAEIVSEALHHRDGKVNRLDAFCIMSSHVDAVIAPVMSKQLAQYLVRRDHRNSKGLLVWAQTGPLPPDARQPDRVLAAPAAEEALTDASRHLETVLSVIMQSLKSYTARKCNLALGREGAFWQHESFDRVIRDDDEFDRTIRYVLNNPVKAGLVSNWKEWKWSYCRPDVERTVSLLPTDLQTESNNSKQSPAGS